MLEPTHSVNIPLPESLGIAFIAKRCPSAQNPCTVQGAWQYKICVNRILNENIARSSHCYSQSRLSPSLDKRELSYCTTLQWCGSVVRQSRTACIPFHKFIWYDFGMTRRSMSPVSHHLIPFHAILWCRTSFPYILRTTAGDNSFPNIQRTTEGGPLYGTLARSRWKVA